MLFLYSRFSPFPCTQDLKMDEGEKKRKAGMVKERMNSSHRRKDFFFQKVMLPFSGWQSKNLFKAKCIHSVWKQIAVRTCWSSSSKERIAVRRYDKINN
jgi:hypothetical protein